MRIPDAPCQDTIYRHLAGNRHYLEAHRLRGNAGQVPLGF